MAKVATVLNIFALTNRGRVIGRHVKVAYSGQIYMAETMTWRGTQSSSYSVMPLEGGYEDTIARGTIPLKARRALDTAHGAPHLRSWKP